MQPLRDYLSKSPLQYESILDPNQDQVMSRLTDEMIRQRIREYCTWDLQKYKRGEIWPATDRGLEITKIDKDEKGWYIETENISYSYFMYYDKSKSFYDYCLSMGQEIDRQKGFLIKDIGIYFRWRKHNGILEIGDLPNLESTDGLPEELDGLSLWQCCQKSKKLEVHNKINILDLTIDGDFKISGNGCKDIIINPDNHDVVAVPGKVTVPSGTKIHYPENHDEYIDLRDKLSKRQYATTKRLLERIPSSIRKHLRPRSE